MAAWVKTSTAAVQAISAQVFTFALLETATGLPSCRPGTTTPANAVNGTVSIADGAWHYIKCTSASGLTNLYVDGALVASSTTQTIVANPPGATNGLEVGSYSGASVFVGEIDEFNYWNVVQSNNTPPTTPFQGTESGLVALYHLDGNGTDCSGLTCVGGTVIPVSSAAFEFSPFNWKCVYSVPCNGATFPQTSMVGAWFSVTFNASANPGAVLQLPSSSTTAQLSYVDPSGVLHDAIPATASVSLAGVVPSASNTFKFYMRTAGGNVRWNSATAAIIIQSLELDTASSAGIAPAFNPAILWHGDSITCGSNAYSSTGNNNGVENGIVTHTFIEMMLLSASYDVGVVCSPGQGYITPGDAVPGLYAVSGGAYSEANSSWDKVDAGVTRLDAIGHLSAHGALNQEPVAVMVDEIGNDANTLASLSDSQASVQGYIGALRNAAPSAKILIVEELPVESLVWPGVSGNLTPTINQNYLNALVNGTNAYKSANPNDSNVTLVDLGASLAKYIYQNGTIYLGDTVTHPNQVGHGLEAPYYHQAFQNAFTISVRPPSIGGNGLNVP